MKNIATLATRWYERTFGPSPDKETAEHLTRMVFLARQAALVFKIRPLECWKEIVEIEHAADEILRQLHQKLDSAFILRFDKDDTAKLCDSIDDVIDEIKKAAMHCLHFRRYLTEMRPEVTTLSDIIIHMTDTLELLVRPVVSSRMSLEFARAYVGILNKDEEAADTLFIDVEQKLVDEFSEPGKEPMGYLAWYNLYRILERTTDYANKCGVTVLSMVRKES